MTWLADRTRQALQEKVLAAVEALDARTAANDRRLLAAFGTLERTRPPSPTPLNAYEKNIQAMLDEILWAVGRRALAQMSPEERDFSTTAVEPRADQVLLLAQGIIPPELEALRNLSFENLRKTP